MTRQLAPVAVDVLSEVLSTLDLTSQLYFRAVLSAPFSIAVPEEKSVIRFHVATGARCSIALSDGEPVLLAPGDLVLVPHGSAHVLADSPGRPARPLPAILDEVRFDGVGPLVFGGGGEETVLVCGHFAFERTLMHPFLAGLPSLIHVRAETATSYGWIERVLLHIQRETHARSRGSAEVVRRLSEILLIEVLRMGGDRGDLEPLAALTDPQLGPVLEAMHAAPERNWALEDLARIAGQSRTVFVERFRGRIGVAPMRYLGSWRMQKARSLLARSGCSVAEVADRVGYASESAFNRAFRAHFGTPPGVYRRRQH